MATRTELVEAIIERYRSSSRADKQRILDEFVAVTGHHRKHAIRVLARRKQLLVKTWRMEMAGLFIVDGGWFRYARRSR